MSIRGSGRPTRSALPAAATLIGTLAIAATGWAAAAETTRRASVAADGAEANSHSAYAAISDRGGVVAFASDANDLVPGDTNGVKDVFVRNLVAGTTERVSVSSTGVQARGPSGRLGQVGISGNGRFVSFVSPARNLVPGDTNKKTDVFVRDLATDTTERVSVRSNGHQGNGPSGDDYGGTPSLSRNGRLVAFVSSARNLVPGDTNGLVDIFVRDRTAGVTRRVSVSTTGRQSDNYSYTPWMAARGRYLVFNSAASHLVAKDTNNTYDVFIHDLDSSTTRRLSVSSSGRQGTKRSYHAAVSRDGRMVAFVSDAPNLVSGDTNGRADVFVRNVKAGTTRRVSVTSAGGQRRLDSVLPTISGDGRLVAFSSRGKLVANDTNGVDDIFVHDVPGGTTRRVSLSAAGKQGNRYSDSPWISGDGRFVAFTSNANNLIASDTNESVDVFVRGPLVP